MKRYLLFLFVVIQAIAFSQETAGIYKLRWNIDKRLTNNFIVDLNGAGNGNAGLNRLTIPTELQDSVLNEIRKIVQQELRVDARYIYSTNRSGKELKTSNTAEAVGGLPRGTKRQAMRSEYLGYYVKFKVNVGVTKMLGVGGEVASYSRLRPYVRVKMKTYGIDRRVKRRKMSSDSDFQTIGSFEYNLGGVSVTNTNTIPISEVVSMVFKGLDKFKNKTR